VVLLVLFAVLILVLNVPVGNILTALLRQYGYLDHQLAAGAARRIRAKTLPTRMLGASKVEVGRRTIYVTKKRSFLVDKA
jgi:hypothetical protein